MVLIKPNFCPKGTNTYLLELGVYKYFFDALKELNQLEKNIFGTAWIWCLITSICWTRQGFSQVKWETLYGLNEKNNIF